MATQLPEKLKYKGRTYEMDSDPLAGYLKVNSIFIPNNFNFSGCQRSYIDTLEIRHKKLYIVSLHTYSIDFSEKKSCMKFLPITMEDTIFFGWLTMEIRYHYGKLKNMFTWAI